LADTGTLFLDDDFLHGVPEATSSSVCSKYMNI